LKEEDVEDVALMVYKEEELDDASKVDSP